MKNLLLFVATFGLSLAAGCIAPVGPQKSDVAVPTNWQNTASTGTVTSSFTVTASSTVDQAWWQHFEDPTLTAALQQALQNNKSLAVAKARVIEARANRGVARAALFPQVQGDASASRGNMGINTFDTTISEAQVGLDASWEVDLFGHNQALSAQAHALLQSEEANEQGTVVELLAEVARNYFDLRNEERQIEITQQNLEKERQTLGVINAQVQGALASDFDVQRTSAEVSSTEARIPALQADRDATLNRLNVLMGVPPGVKNDLFASTSTLKALDPSIVVAAPTSVLANRPDVRMAERQLAATLSAKRAALSDFFPQITLLGFYGFQSSNLYVLSPWNLGGELVQPILNFGLLRSRYKIATARQQESFFQYQETVLEALENMNNALSRFLHEYDRNRLLSATVDGDRKAASLANLQFNAGYTDLLDVLVAERNELDAESALISSDTLLRQDLVAIYTAAGGGWSADTTSK